MYETRFALELAGKYGEYWQNDAKERIRKMQVDVDSGNVLVDSDGAAYWANSGNYLPSDCVEILGYTNCKFSREATAKAREKQLDEAVEIYRRNYRGPSEEELIEIRAVFGEGETIVDVITGDEIIL